LVAEKRCGITAHPLISSITLNLTNPIFTRNENLKKGGGERKHHTPTIQRGKKSTQKTVYMKKRHHNQCCITLHKRTREEERRERGKGCMRERERGSIQSK
jgi:hypothetical protein